MQLQRFLLPSLCVLIPAALLAQSQVDFSPLVSTAGNTPSNIYAIDVNNDGVTDIVQDSGLSPSGFSVSVSNGNGTFKTPVSYTLPGTESVPNCIAPADFNNDGNIDLAVPLMNTNQIAVYRGKGDGTFQAPIFSTVNLPSGSVFSMAGCSAADFNADGDIDLAVWTNNGYGMESATTELYVLKGEGNGNFSASPYPVLASTSLQPDLQVFVGDYDSDGIADIAATTSVEDYSTGDTTSTTIHVLYGNKDFTFDATTAYAASGIMTIGSGDLNSDGKTDVWALTGAHSGAQQLGLFYGNTSRTFDSYWMDTSASYPVGATPNSWYWQPELTMADYNGDSHMDLAAVAMDSNYNPGYMELFLSNGQPGQFTTQVISLPHAYVNESEPGAGLFSGSYLTPDVTLNQSPNSGSPPQNTPSYLTAELNKGSSGYFGPCQYPKSSVGFNPCVGGGVIGNSVQFSTAVNSFGQLRKIELWVDGKKVSEQHHTWGTHAYFDYSSSFSNGKHQATFYAADVDNRLQRYDFAFTVGAACSAFSTPGVHVCGPAVNGESSPIQALATATITGQLARMEVWVDGVKQYSETSSTTLNTTLDVRPGAHEFDFYAVSTVGTKWETIVDTNVQ